MAASRRVGPQSRTRILRALCAPGSLELPWLPGQWAKRALWGTWGGPGASWVRIGFRGLPWATWVVRGGHEPCRTCAAPAQYRHITCTLSTRYPDRTHAQYPHRTSTAPLHHSSSILAGVPPTAPGSLAVPLRYTHRTHTDVHDLAFHRTCWAWSQEVFVALCNVSLRPRPLARRAIV